MNDDINLIKALKKAWPILLLGIIPFLLIPLLLYFYTDNPSVDVSLRWFSVFLGFVLSTVITFLLLERQTATQLAQKKDEKVYEEKIKAYKDIIKKTCNVVKDFKVEPHESIELQSLIALMAMHSPQLTQKVVKAIADIREKTKKNNGIIVQELNKVASIFHAELYNEYENIEIKYCEDDLVNAFKKTEESKENKPDNKDKDAFISEINQQGNDEISHDGDEPSETPERQDFEETDIEEAKTRWEDWLLAENDSGWNLVLYSKKKRGELGVYRWYSGDLVLEAQYPDDGREFSQAVGWHEKTTLKSYRGKWRKMLKEEFRKYNNDEVIEEYHKDNSRFRQYIDEEFDKFLKYIDRHNVRATWKNALKLKIEEKGLGWSVGIWDFDTLYTDIPAESPTYGRVYIDTHLVDNDKKMVVYVSDREHRAVEMENLKKLFPKMEVWKEDSTGYIFLKYYFDAPAANADLAEKIAEELTSIQEKIRQAG